MKFWKTLFFTMATVLGISSCSDVPEPYLTPGTGTVEGVILNADFSNSLNKFTSESESGSLNWYNDFSSVMVTGYQDFNGDGTKENQAGVTYLVSPELDMTTTGEAYILLNMAINYERGDINANNSVLITKNYTGEAATTEWTQLTYDTEGLGTSFTFTDKGINIPTEFIGNKVRIALRHTCNESQSSTWEVKKMQVLEGKYETEEGILNADFSSSLNNFTSISESGNLNWYNDFSSAMITGYQDFNGDGTKENQAGVTYLVSPELDMTAVSKAYILLNMAINYERGDINNNNSVLITKNYTGEAATTEWTQLSYDTEGLGTSFTFADKGINIPAEFTGTKVRIALRHTCDESQSSTWEVKRMQVLEGTYEGSTPDPEEPAEGEFLSQDFSNSLGNFTSVSSTGSLSWYNDFSSAMVTGYQDFNGDGTKENQGGVTYFVSPAFTIKDVTSAHIAINMAINYERADINTNNAILISKDYTGDVNSASWTQLPYDTEGLGSSFTFTEKQINIPAEFIGSSVVVALRHTCNDTQSSTWEVKSIKVASGSAEDPSTDPDPGTSGDTEILVEGTTVTLTNPNATASTVVTSTALNSFGWSNQGEPTGASDSEGTSFVFAQEDGRNNPLYYDATGGVRMYALNSLTLQASKPIAKVVLTCDSYSGTNYVGNPTLYADINGNNWKIINDHTSNSGGVQLRIKAIEITYAE